MTNIAPEPSKHGSGERAIRSKGEPPAGGRFGSWPLLTLAFGSLVALMIVSGVATVNKATNLYSTLSRLNREYRQHWRSVEEIQSGIHVSSVLIRDYLLDPSQERAKETRDELLKVRKQMEGLLAPAELAHLRKEIDAYWDTFDPVFEWEADDKKAMGFWFLRQRVMPRREAALALALEAQNLTEVTFRRQREEIRQNEEELRGYVWRMLAATVLLGALVAAGSIVRVWQLEKRSRRAEDEMRRLSHELVSAQEEERRAISRELHDEVGQMLTGLRMDLRALQKAQRADPARFDERIEETRVVLEQTLQAVRDIAMGLRPSMLDDLGLEAALEWQVRDFERRHEIAVTLQVETTLDELPDRYRTNLYRIVQEALTNCARHAKARSATIRIHRDEDGALRLRIEDDGIGITGKPTAGLGLIGIQERVRELGGAVRVESLRGKGTALDVALDAEVAQHG